MNKQRQNIILALLLSIVLCNLLIIIFDPIGVLLLLILFAIGYETFKLLSKN
jgi:hypothetical protein